jgi:hypothetical protein
MDISMKKTDTEPSRPSRTELSPDAAELLLQYAGVVRGGKNELEMRLADMANAAAQNQARRTAAMLGAQGLGDPSFAPGPYPQRPDTLAEAY